jgi:hypothetical protein
MVPPSFQLSSSRGVLATGIFKAGLLLVLVPALLQPMLVGGDVPLAMLVAVNWWLSGYVNTGSYLLAPKLVAAVDAIPTVSSSSRQQSNCVIRKHGSSVCRHGVGYGKVSGWRIPDDAAVDNLRARAGGLMACCFQVSCLLGLMGALAIQRVLLVDKAGKQYRKVDAYISPPGWSSSLGMDATERHI